MPSDLRIRGLSASAMASLTRQAQERGLPVAWYATMLLADAIFARAGPPQPVWSPSLPVVARHSPSQPALTLSGGVGGVSLPAPKKMPEDCTDVGQEPSRGDVVTELPLPTEVGSAREQADNGKKSLPRKYEAIREHLSTVLAEVQAGTRARLNAQEMRDVQAELLFAYWQARLHHESALLDDKRLNRLRARLRENGGNVHELLFVVDGALKDRNLMGENERNRKYDGIETLFRDRGQVERLAELGGWKPEKRHPMADKYLSGAA